MSLSIYQIIIDKMLSYHNKTIYDLKNDSDFYYKNKLTSEQYFEWYEWSLNLLYQNFPNRKQEDIKKEFDFFDITRGLLYIYERPVSVWTEEDEKEFNEIKQKRIGKDTTLKEL
jgi:hypothetical protein